MACDINGIKQTISAVFSSESSFTMARDQAIDFMAATVAKIGTSENRVFSLGRSMRSLAGDVAAIVAGRYSCKDESAIKEVTDHAFLLERKNFEYAVAVLQNECPSLRTEPVKDELGSRLVGEDVYYPQPLAILMDEMSGQEYKYASRLFGYNRDSTSWIDYWNDGADELFAKDSLVRTTGKVGAGLVDLAVGSLLSAECTLLASVAYLGALEVAAVGWISLASGVVFGSGISVIANSIINAATSVDGE